MESFKIFSMCARSKSDFSTLYKEDCLRIEFQLIFVRRPSLNKSWSGTKDAFSLLPQYLSLKHLIASLQRNIVVHYFNFCTSYNIE